MKSLKLDFFSAITNFFAGIKTEEANKEREKYVRFHAEKLCLNEEMPKARYGGASIVVPNHAGYKIYMFGGTTEGGAYTYFDDVWELSVTKGVNDEDIICKFNHCETTGDRPTGRFGHRTVYLPATNQMLMFGGYSRNNTGAADVYSLSLDGTFTWKVLETFGRGPSPRFTHSMCTVDNGQRVIVFGGFNSQDRLNDLFVLDAQTWTWTQVIARGNIPSPRNSHSSFVAPSRGVSVSNGLNSKISMAHYNADIMYVFGGRTETERYSDLYALNTHTMEWSYINTTGNIPCPRSSQTASVCGSYLCVFGGFDGKDSLNTFHLLDLETFNWIGSQPHETVGPRDRHIAEVVFVGETSAKMIVFGGFDGSSMLGDLHLVTVDLPLNMLHTHMHEMMDDGSVTTSEVVSIKCNGLTQQQLVADAHACMLFARLHSARQ